MLEKYLDKCKIYSKMCRMYSVCFIRRYKFYSKPFHPAKQLSSYAQSTSNNARGYSCGARRTAAHFMYKWKVSKSNMQFQFFLWRDCQSQLYFRQLASLYTTCYMFRHFYDSIIKHVSKI